MAALAPILLTSIAATSCITTSATVAEDTTYAPEGWKPGNVASWVNRAGGIPVGYPRFTFQLKAPTNNSTSRVYRVSAKFFTPVLETIDPAVGIFGPKLAYELQAHIDLLIPERATSAERLVFLSYLRSVFFAGLAASDGAPTAVTGSPLVGAITSLEDVY